MAGKVTVQAAAKSVFDKFHTEDEFFQCDPDRSAHPSARKAALLEKRSPQTRNMEGRRKRRTKLLSGFCLVQHGFLPEDRNRQKYPVPAQKKETKWEAAD